MGQFRFLSWSSFCGFLQTFGWSDSVTENMSGTGNGSCQVGICTGHLKKFWSVLDFMDESPFYGRVPVFVGDDVTDEDGFAAVNRMGGCSIRVGDAADETTAQYRIANVTAVLDWLAAVAAEADAGERGA